jgi:endoglucanase
MLTRLFLVIIPLFQCIISCTNNQSVTHSKLLINQVGYIPSERKAALVKEYSGAFNIMDSKKNIVLSGRTSALKTWNHSNEQYAVIDFTELKTPGKYHISIDGEYSPEIINLSYNYPQEALKLALRSYYLNRASMAIHEKYAGEWARPMGHPDTSVMIHSSAINSTIAPGSLLNSSGGWYDAGDYNKYIVNSSITVYTLLAAYEHYKSSFVDSELNIPESGNNIPDILDETIYNVRWMLTMQDADGGVFHKLTTLTFENFVMPHEAISQRYMVMKTTPATLDFAASMAACSRIISGVEGLALLADSCMKASKHAWAWAVQNKDVFYIQPEDIKTGEYNDTNLTDEWSWAATELAIATGNQAYFLGNEPYNLHFSAATPSWDLVNTLGLMSILSNKESFDEEQYAQAHKEYFTLADSLLDIYKNSPALTSLDYFKWGSNSDVANQAMLGLFAYELSGIAAFKEMAFSNIDYLMGRNPTGFCYVTGLGKKSPQNIHHRPSGADKIEEPVPGFLVGGPNTIVLNDCGTAVVRSVYPALSFTDSECSYSTNEVAINWNAPLVYALAGVRAETERQPYLGKE